MSGGSAGKAVRQTIAEFVADYKTGAERRRLTRSEQQLMADALTSYICHEQWLAAEPDAAEMVRSITAAGASDTAAQPAVVALLDGTASMITDLAERLARSDHANLIMREHLASMSEQLRLVGGKA